MMNELPFIAIQKTLKGELKVNKALYHQVHINLPIAIQQKCSLLFNSKDVLGCTFR